LATFAGLNWLIPANTVKSLIVTGTLPKETAIADLQMIIKGGTNLNVSGISSAKTILAQGTASGNVFKIVLAGSLSVSLAETTPPALNLSKGKTYLDFLKINFNATDAEAISVKAITLLRDGCTDADFSQLRIYDVGTKLSQDVSFVNGEASFNLVNNPAWQIPPAGIKTLTVKADLSTLDPATCQVRLCLATSSNANYQVSAEGAASGIAINVAAKVPLCGNYMQLVGLTPAITLIVPNGGERWEKSKTYDINWDSVSMGVGDVKIDISLWKINLNGTSVLSQTIASGIDPISGKYTWTIPQTLAIGRYKIALFAVGAGKSDESDSYFYIIN